MEDLEVDVIDAVDRGVESVEGSVVEKLVVPGVLRHDVGRQVTGVGGTVARHDHGARVVTDGVVVSRNGNGRRDGIEDEEVRARGAGSKSRPSS